MNGWLHRVLGWCGHLSLLEELDVLLRRPKLLHGTAEFVAEGKDGGLVLLDERQEGIDRGPPRDRDEVWDRGRRRVIHRHSWGEPGGLLAVVRRRLLTGLARNCFLGAWAVGEGAVGWVGLVVQMVLGLVVGPRLGTGSGNTVRLLFGLDSVWIRGLVELLVGVPWVIG